MSLPKYTPLEFGGLVEEVVGFVNQKREALRPGARHLDAAERKKFSRFFSAKSLTEALIAAEGTRIEDPPFARRARKRGFGMLPTYPHMPEITLCDVIVLQARRTDRLLFHSLVHTVQYFQLGVELYVELYLRAFIRNGLYVTVPMEAHAYELDQRFAGQPEESFSVEASVKQWIKDGRYEGEKRRGLFRKS